MRCIPAFIICILWACSGVKSTVTREDDLKKTAIQVLQALAKRDSAALSRFISPELGIWMIHRPGAIDYIDHSFTASPPPKIQYPWVMGPFMQVEKQVVLKSGLNQFSCDSNEWQHSGFFYCDTCNDNKLTIIQNFMIEWKLAEVTENQRKLAAMALKGDVKFWYVEDRTDRGLVFHLTELNGKWWLTILNFVESDCGV